MRSFVLVLTALVLVTCLGGSSGQPPGGSCDADDDCQGELLCAYGRCRSACVFDRDCEPGATCVPDAAGSGRVCTVDDEGACGGFEPCPGALACRDELCLAPCDGGVCAAGYVCDEDLCVGISCPCDIDGSGLCDDADTDAFVELVGTGVCGSPCPCDMNGDGLCNFYDIDSFNEERARPECH